MLAFDLRPVVEEKLAELFPASTERPRYTSVGGGCINDACRIDAGNRSFFCKVNSATKFPQMLQAEKEGLELIGGQNIIRVPAVIACFESGGWQVLLLEWMDEEHPTNEFWKKFGEQLAALHQISGDFFGLAGDNYMGNIPQSNRPAAGWVEFFVGQRVEPLVRKATSLDLLEVRHRAQFDRLYGKLPRIFPEGSGPALLHGDLWSGNFMCGKGGIPVLIDTAVYFGNASMDLGMTQLFGGFSPLFYEAYRYHTPFPPGYQDQWEVSNLYPLLIHLILFGASYRTSIEHTLDRFT